MYSFFYDPMFIWVILVFILALFAQSRVSSAFRKWSRVGSKRGLTAREVARNILDNAGLSGMPVNRVAGNLTDHYNPVRRTLNLSDAVYGSDSIAALGIAAHEAGHAIQHKTSFAPLVLRNGIYPLSRIGSFMAYPLFIMGLLMGQNQTMIRIAIYLFAFATAFTVITLPVEFNASVRAKRILVRQGYLSRGEMTGVNAVLNAAAMTYVASALMAVVNLLRMIVLGGRVRN